MVSLASNQKCSHYLQDILCRSYITYYVQMNKHLNIQYWNVRGMMYRLKKYYTGGCTSDIIYRMKYQHNIQMKNCEHMFYRWIMAWQQIEEILSYSTTAYYGHRIE